MSVRIADLGGGNLPSGWYAAGHPAGNTIYEAAVALVRLGQPTPFYLKFTSRDLKQYKIVPYDQADIRVYVA